MKKILITLILPACLHIAYGQKKTSPSILMEEWSKEPALHQIDSKYNSESAVILLDKRRMEYVDESAGQTLVVYRTLHKIIRVNDDKGIASFNRIYLGVTDNSDIVDIRARTILPDGKVVEIDKENIKDLKEADGNIYKIFAMEGLEKGCEVEYYYTYKRKAAFFGREMMQGPFPVLEAQLQILAPERLIFEMKGYNCSIDPGNAVNSGKRWISTSLKDIAGAEREKYAAYDVNLRRIEFRLSDNHAAKKDQRLFTWDELAKRVYAAFTSRSDKEARKTEGLINDNKWGELASEEDKIIAVERYLKKNITTREDIRSEEAEKIDMIIKNGIASHHGIVRLYAAIYDKLGVNYQIVMTCNRSESVIDRNFENWNSADIILLYFPNTDKYLEPVVLGTRYPWINPFCGLTDGLFVTSANSGSAATTSADIKPIPLEDYSKSYNNLESKVSFNPGNDSMLVDMKQLYGGYSATNFRAGYILASAEDKKTFIKNILRVGTNNAENIVSSEVQNADFESFSDNKPFIVHAVLKANELIERAGSKVLVKVGELIGPQTEMYQEKPRQFPVQMPYPHKEERDIVFTIPEGYIVKNPDDLSINKLVTDKGDTTMGFTSTYRLEGNLLTIHVLEQYRRSSYPLSEYEDFKKVINSSADFNKIVLVLQKK